MSMSGLIPRLLPVCRELPRNEAITVREAQCEALTWQCVLRYYHNCCLYRPDKEESLADINRSGWSHRGQGVWSPPYHQMPSGKGVVSFIDSDVDPSPVSSLYQWAPHLCRTHAAETRLEGDPLYWSVYMMTLRNNEIWVTVHKLN